MPMNGGGTSSRVPGTTAVPNQTIKSADYNAEIDDLYNILNTVRPLVYGGTGAATAVGAIDNLSTKGADIASATTTDLSAATGDYVVVTGTTTITGLGTAPAGVERTVRFSGALTLTHNSTSLILPGGVNITTAAGDIAVFRSEGSGNWRGISYQPASPIPVYQEGTWTPLDASGAALSFTTVSGNYIKIGRLVVAHFKLTYPSTVSGGTALIGALPFAIVNASTGYGIGAAWSSAAYPNGAMNILGTPNGTSFSFISTALASQPTNANLSLVTVSGTLTYIATS